jgi:hypothetical protein
MVSGRLDQTRGGFVEYRSRARAFVLWSLEHAEGQPSIRAIKPTRTCFALKILSETYNMQRDLSAMVGMWSIGELSH